jgi:parallel beta-helix repeat protein
VNENFTYLLKRFGTRQTSVNCSAGESITTALQNYNHIVISGICTENLSLNGTTLPHRLVILEGSSSSSDGISASDTSIPVVHVYKGAITLKVSKLKLSGGTNGLNAYRGPTIILKNALIENNTRQGVTLTTGTNGKIESSTIQNNGTHGIIVGYSSSINITGNTISGHSNASSILIYASSGAYIVRNTITGGKHSGIAVSGGSFARIGGDPESGVSQGNTIQSSENGISVQDSSNAILKYNTVKNNSKSGLRVDNNGSVVLAEGNTFSNNSGYGIRVWLAGSLTMWGGAQLTSPTTISGNTKGPIRVDEGGSALLSNLTLASPNKGIIIQNANFVKLDNVTITGSGDFGINVWGTNIGLENSTISGSTNAEIFAKFSTINLEKTSITGTAGSDEIKLNYGSMLFIGTGTTITGTVTCDGSVDNNSIDNWTNLTLTTSGC